jgi:hypothetical protein
LSTQTHTQWELGTPSSDAGVKDIKFTYPICEEFKVHPNVCLNGFVLNETQGLLYLISQLLAVKIKTLNLPLEDLKKIHN